MGVEDIVSLQAFLAFPIELPEDIVIGVLKGMSDFVKELGAGGFGVGVGCIHNAGDWMEYKAKVPADGSYAFWVRHGSHNKPFGLDGMNERTTISVDGGKPVPLVNLGDTGGWGIHEWGRGASLELKAGAHVLKWQNVRGGGIDLDAFVLCNDPKWTPGDWPLKPSSPGSHRVVIQAEDFSACQGKQLRVGTRSEI